MDKQYSHIWISMAILALSILGMLGVLPLVQREFATGNVCLRLFGIPACYIIASCLTLVFVSLLNTVGNKNYLFFWATGISLSIALMGSIGNLTGYLDCPEIKSGIPKCYLSLLLFAALIILKRKAIRLEK